MKWVWVLVVVCSCAVAQDGRLIGHVVATNGLWCDETLHSCGKPLPGNTVGILFPVRSDSRLRRTGILTGHEWIDIRSYMTGTIVVFDCSVAIDCAEDLDLQKLYPQAGQPAASSTAEAFFDAIRRLLATEPAVLDRYRQGSLRSVSAKGSLRDTVIRFDGPRMSVNQILEQMPDGSYSLELCPIDGHAAVHCASTAPSRYRWIKSNPVPWARSNFTPGLYRIYVCSKIGDFFIRSDNFASVYVVPPDKYSDARRLFQHALEVTKDWDPDDPTTRPLMSIYLHALAYQSASRYTGTAPQ